MIWILLVLVYGICKGLREVLKKKALETSSTIEVLFIYTFISFLFVTPELPKAGGVPGLTMLYIAIKSLMVFIAWIASFTAVKHVAVGFYGILDQSRVVFATLLGVLVLGESMGIGQIVGVILVIGGMLMLKLMPSEKKRAVEEKSRAKYVILIIISCLFNAISGLMDKMLMSAGNLTSGQLQFWYMLFLVVYYLLYILVLKPEIHWKQAIRNYWIWLLAILFVVADRCLFIANGYPESKVTIMTLVKQSSCVVTIIGGRVVFHEKGIVGKLICAGVVIAGILCSALL